MSELFDPPVVPRLEVLLREFEKGEIQIPAFQRPSLWRDDQRLDLLDSVRRGLPIGALLVWRTQQHRLETLDVLRGSPSADTAVVSSPRTYLIDGHQRVTTLFEALLVPSRGEGEEPRPILVDLEPSGGGPPVFVLESQRTPPTPTRVSTQVLLDPQALHAAQARLWGDHAEAARRLFDMAQRFRDYPLPILPMRSEQLEDVIEAFTRVNRGGTKMSPADLTLALAQTHAGGSGPGLREALEDFTERYQREGWAKLDASAVLDLLLIRHGLDVYRGDRNRLLTTLFADDGSGRRTLDGDLEALRGGLDAAFRLLAECGSTARARCPTAFSSCSWRSGSQSSALPRLAAS